MKALSKGRAKLSRNWILQYLLSRRSLFRAATSPHGPCSESRVSSVNPGKDVQETKVPKLRHETRIASGGRPASLNPETTASFLQALDGLPRRLSAVG